VLVLAKATAAAAYRDADVATGVIRGDRAALVAGVRSAMTAHAIVAFTAAVLAMTPLLVALLG
jgi:hypothetical protein